ncbi:MAG: YjjG family noncanonical pyrimidine nucleotidase [Eubacteriales bacterium]|nr:YjjG family noncanonical pyrimidine nucleotidase [Eubacteriales bacterium]
MKKYEFLLFDADGTLLDFDRCEYEGLKLTFADLGIYYDKQTHAVFNAVNKALWRDYDDGKIQREKLLLLRFDIVFEKLGVVADSVLAESLYRDYLGKQHFVLDGATEILEYLKDKYRMFIVTNGIKKTQHTRLNESGLDKYFEKIFISDEIGFNKPHKEFFDIATAMIDGFEPTRALVIGDSLSGDIKGANNAGLDCCWFNPSKVKMDRDVRVDFEINDLSKLYEIL